MKFALRMLWTVLFFAVAAPGFAAQKHVAWSARFAPKDARAGEGAEIVVVGKIDPAWHIYALHVPPSGPFATSVTLTVPGILRGSGSALEKPAVSVMDKGFGIKIPEHAGTAVFAIPVTLKPGAKGAQQATVHVSYQVCSGSVCFPPQKEDLIVSFKVAPGAARPAKRKPVKTVPIAATFSDSDDINSDPLQGAVVLVGGPEETASSPETAETATTSSAQQIENAKHRGLFSFVLLSIGFGFAALLTPCVFPIIPLTVSYFTKRKAGERGGGVSGAVAYCLGIISTFTVIGVGVSLIFGGSTLNRIATNPFVNIGFAILFIFLALNLMGLFEIPVPAGLANKVQTDSAKRGGYLQPYLLGLAFTLTSFTCTTAYVGTLLAAAARGDRLYPIIGMLAFSSAFALPFFLLALFPQALARMPKSGSWLVTVKAFMGMLEIAAAVKFLSQADLVWGRGLLTRPIFLGLWGLIGIFAGLYLIGLIKLPKQDREKIGPTRYAIGIATILIGIYCGSLVRLSPPSWTVGFLPPAPYPYRLTAVSDKTQTPANSGKNIWLDNYEAAVGQAKAQNKPILINFTGVTCTNCRQMENGVFTRPEVQTELHNFILAELYTDRGTPADEANGNLEDKLVNNIALPYYVIVSPDGKILKTIDGLRTASVFVQFLQQGRSTNVSVK